MTTLFSTAWSELESRIQYSFKDQYLLREAMTHPSYLDDRDFAGNNQRLEFLGDSILGLLVAERLFLEFRGLAEGALTHIKSIMVSERVLAQIAQRLELQHCLRMGASVKKSHQKVDAFMADAVESLLGAIFLDGGWTQAQKFRDEVFWELAYPLISQEQMTDYKGALLRLAQSRSLPQPTYKDISTEGPAHAPTFVVRVIWDHQEFAEGRGGSKKVASTEAARLALQKLTEGED